MYDRDYSWNAQTVQQSGDWNHNTDQYKVDQYKADQYKVDQYKVDQYKVDQYKVDEVNLTPQYHNGQVVSSEQCLRLPQSIAAGNLTYPECHTPPVAQIGYFSSRHQRYRAIHRQNLSHPYGRIPRFQNDCMYSSGNEIQVLLKRSKFLIFKKYLKTFECFFFFLI